MARSPQALASARISSFAYRTGFYVGALHGYQIVSEVSPVDGPEFCQGFADGIAVIMSWLKRYLAEGGTFEGALGDLMPYFPALRSWVGDATTTGAPAAVKPPGRRDRQRRQWEQLVLRSLTSDRWWTAQEIAERLDGQGPPSVRALQLVLHHLVATGQIERTTVADLANPRHGGARWRLTAARGIVQSVQ